MYLPLKSKFFFQGLPLNFFFQRLSPKKGMIIVIYSFNKTVILIESLSNIFAFFLFIISHIL